MKRTLLLLTLAVACSRAETPAPPPPPAAAQLVAGDPERGRALVPQYACNACHIIPGTTGPQGSLAPTLAGLASRPTISYGAVQNTPANLRQFIQNPSSLNPQSAMPPIGLPDNDAQDITAFLVTLR
jgi:cytochrome c2